MAAEKRRSEFIRAYRARGFSEKQATVLLGLFGELAKRTRRRARFIAVAGVSAGVAVGSVVTWLATRG